MNQKRFQDQTNQEKKEIVKKSKIEKVAKDMREGVNCMIKEKTQREKRKIAEGLWEGINIMERSLRKLMLENTRLLNKVEPEFCHKCCRRTLADVETEKWMYWRMQDFTTIIERKEVMTLLLLIRKHCPTTPFFADVLPLDIFKKILVLAGVCKVVEWKDLSVPERIQFLLKESKKKDVLVTKNAVLKGTFKIMNLFEVDRFSISFGNHFIKTENLEPVYTEEEGVMKLRWDDPENLEFWCEFTLTPQGPLLKGRIPPDTKCLGFTNYKDKDLRWTFGSESDETFWADVYIYN